MPSPALLEDILSLNIGDTIDGKYRIVRLLGEGGMGAVFEGENLRIKRRVAIKILHSNVAESQDAVQRFEREAQAAGRIGSDHIVEVLDLGELPDGDRYMVMEFLDGEALSDRIKNSGGLPPRQAAEIVLDMLEGLQAAHAAGIVHRDLKPENVFLLKEKAGKADFVKIVDFGISKFSSLGGEFSMTRTGAVMGTPYYLSPEQAKGDRNLDHRADVYAAGVILYEAVAGRVPFEGETFNELLFKIVLEPVQPLSEVAEGVDPDFSNLVSRAMARELDDRFQTADQLSIALRGWLDGLPMPIAKTVMGGGVRAQAGTTATEPAPPMAATALGPQGTATETVTRTHGAWANTNADGTPVANKSSSKLWMGVAAAGILLVGGGVFAMRAQDQAAEEAATAARAAAIEETKAEQREKERLEKLAELEAQKVKAEAEKAAAEAAKLQAEKQAVEAKLSAVEQARIAEEEAKKDAARQAVVSRHRNLVVEGSLDLRRARMQRKKSPEGTRFRGGSASGQVGSKFRGVVAAMDRGVPPLALGR